MLLRMAKFHSFSCLSSIPLWLFKVIYSLTVLEVRTLKSGISKVLLVNRRSHSIRVGHKFNLTGVL